MHALELLLCKSIVIYRNKAALDQFLEGLLKYVKENPASPKELFSFAPYLLTVASFRRLLTINYSETGSNKNNQAQEGEEATVLWWEEFLANLEWSDPECLLPQLLIFIIAEDNIPVLGFPKSMDINFFYII